MIIRQATHSDRDAYYKLVEYCFEYPPGGIDFEKKLFDPAQCLMMCDDADHIVGGLIVYDHDMRHGNGTVDMGGISLVAIDPTIRYGGHGKALLRYAIKHMKDKGKTFSLLEPFDYPFYNKLGWELAFDRMMVEMSIHDLRNMATTAYQYERFDRMPIERIRTLYDDFYGRYPTTCIKKDHQFNKLATLLQDYGFHTCIATQDDQVRGMMVYRISKDTLLVREMIWTDIAAQKALWGYVYNHNSQFEKVTAILPADDMIRHLAFTPDFKCEIKPFMMNRIIDIHKALEHNAYSCNDCNIIIQVDDPIASWNEGTWKLIIQDGKGHLHPTQETPDVTLSIGRLSQLTIGYLDMNTIIHLEGCILHDSSLLPILIDVFPKKVTLMNEKF